MAPVFVDPSPSIDGVFTVRPTVHTDDRGTFAETYRQSWFPAGRAMVQANLAERSAGSVVGLHYHLRQSDYWFPTRGHARVVLHDLRPASATNGATEVFDVVGEETSNGRSNRCGIYIPPGVAHGFSAVTDILLSYLVDHYYDPDDELGMAWDDPSVAADWGVTRPVLSDRDKANPRRVDVDLGPLSHLVAVTRR